MPFWTYILHCRGGAFYTGHTDDLDYRIAQHQSGLGGAFTSERLPVELVWTQEFPSRQQAFENERKIKGWSRAKKLALIRGDWDAVARYAKGKGGPSTSSGRAELGGDREEGVSTRTDVTVPAPILAQLHAHAAAAHPHECCGLLLGHGDSIAAAQLAANTHPTPATHFEIDPAALIAALRAARAGGPQVLGYYHSHPHGPPAPSATDRAQASGDGRVWAIIGAGQIGWFRDLPDGFVPLACIAIGE